MSALLVVGVLVSGCSAVNQATFGPTEEVSAERLAELNGQLRELPSLEATLEEYRGVRASLVEQIEAIAPGVRFESTTEPGDHYPDDRRSCSGEWLDTDGMSVDLAMWVSDVPIGEEAWLQAVAIVRKAASDRGIVYESAINSVPGDREIRFSNSENATINLSSFKAAVLSIRTSCRLPKGPAVPTPPRLQTNVTPAGEG
ncbi:LppA family lipoprotein [Gordonia sp. HS-NH1]|uniref:LppA family lipoprotein n=1 Tax=Gordonia sp. HS-NH1 TaxID=1435068 RepID=UPI0009FEA0F2|nr:LppA family lipoprotein [Gordonia sp. HS-NH1]